jgi:uncharacterized membrane protein YdjX (TVP38/TMEM64 family)
VPPLPGRSGAVSHTPVSTDRLPSRAGLRFALFVGLVLVTASFAVWRTRHGMPFTAEAVRTEVMSWGALAPAIYIGAWVLRPFLFFPTILLFVGGGLVFGALWGTVYAAIGGTLAGAVTFWIARALGREFVQQRVRNRFPQCHEESWGPGLVFVLNLIPIFPVTVINYGAGLSQIGLGAFLVAELAGLTPRAFAYSFFGSSILDIRSPEFAGAVALLVSLVVAPALLRRRFVTARHVARRRASEA